MISINRLLSRLEKVKSVGKDKWMSLCPAHDDHNPSLSIKKVDGEKILLNCLAGCETEKVLSALGLTFSDLSTNNGSKAQKKRIVATYDYCDENGKLLFQVVRYHPKDFRQRRPGKRDGWIWNTKNVEKVLYRLPEVLEADEVWLTEGEKDCDNLRKLGLVATTIPGGAGKSGACHKNNPGFFHPLREKRVYIIPDNDSVGREHAKQLAQMAVSSLAKEVKIINLPGLPPKGDVSDFIKQHGDKAKGMLLELAKRAKSFRPTKEQETEAVIVQRFTPRPFSNVVLKRNKLIYDKFKRFWRYDKATGLWVENAEVVLEKQLREGVLDYENLLRYCVREVLDDVKALTYKPEPLPEAPPALIPFCNGVFDLDAVELRPYRPDDFLTVQLPVNYKLTAKCPLIDRIFAELVDNPIDLYELCAYSLWRGYPYQKIFFLYGGGGNGKSLFLNILIKMLGKTNVKSIDLHQLQTNRFASAELFGKLVAACGESKYKTLTDTDILKRLTGNDYFRAERKYKDAFSFYNHAKIIVNTNEIPKTADKTRAFYRRIFLIEFPNVFTGKQEDKTLINKISQGEIEGLAARCITVLQDLRGRGFFFTNDKTPEETEEMYERMTNPLKEFLDTYTEELPEGAIPRHYLSAMFCLWQKLNKRRVWTDKAITQEMKALGYDFSQRTVDTHDAFSQLSQVSQRFSNNFSEEMKQKGLKQPVNVVNVVKLEEPPKEKMIWRCWLGLKWKLPAPNKEPDGDLLRPASQADLDTRDTMDTKKQLLSKSTKSTKKLQPLFDDHGTPSKRAHKKFSLEL